MIVSGNPHSVWLRAVKYNDKIYFSRHRPDGDWYQNAIVNPEVKIQYNNMEFSGKATPVTDEKLNEKLSQMKYLPTLDKQLKNQTILYEDIL